MKMDKESINIALQEIINSNTFNKSETFKQLLSYLTNATLEKKVIKEYTIAQEVFNKDSNWGVRVYMHNLRKKLAEYYKYEGAKSTYIFSIPKGQYYIDFENRKNANNRRRKIFITPVRIAILGTIFICIISFIVYFQSINKIEKSIIWSEFMNTEEPILIVIGDHYFYGSNAVTGGGMGVMRDFNINSESEFNAMLLKKPALKDSIYKINYSYTSKQGLQSLFSIIPYLKNNKNLSLKLSSELNFDDIKQNNIIYFGKFHTLKILGELVYGKYFDFDKKYVLHYKLNDIFYDEYLLIDNFEKIDYPVVLKFRTPNQKNILMFISNDDPGEIAVLNYFLDYKNIKFIENKLQLTNKDNTFTTLFKVNSLVRTDMSIEFITGTKLKEGLIKTKIKQN